LPWLAAFFLRAFFLRDFFAMRLRSFRGDIHPMQLAESG
jgi:hypothetical protein